MVARGASDGVLQLNYETPKGTTGAEQCSTSENDICVYTFPEDTVYEIIADLDNKALPNNCYEQFPCLDTLQGNQSVNVRFTADGVDREVDIVGAFINDAYLNLFEDVTLGDEETASSTYTEADYSAYTHELKRDIDNEYLSYWDKSNDGFSIKTLGDDSFFTGRSILINYQSLDDDDCAKFSGIINDRLLNGHHIIGGPLRADDYSLPPSTGCGPTGGIDLIVSDTMDMREGLRSLELIQDAAIKTYIGQGANSLSISNISSTFNDLYLDYYDGYLINSESFEHIFNDSGHGEVTVSSTNSANNEFDMILTNVGAKNCIDLTAAALSSKMFSAAMINGSAINNSEDFSGICNLHSENTVTLTTNITKGIPSTNLGKNEIDFLSGALSQVGASDGTFEESHLRNVISNNQATAHRIKDEMITSAFPIDGLSELARVNAYSRTLNSVNGIEVTYDDVPHKACVEMLSEAFSNPRFTSVEGFIPVDTITDIPEACGPGINHLLLFYK